MELVAGGAAIVVSKNEPNYSNERQLHHIQNMPTHMIKVGEQHKWVLTKSSYLPVKWILSALLLFVFGVILVAALWNSVPWVGLWIIAISVLACGVQFCMLSPSKWAVFDDHSQQIYVEFHQPYTCGKSTVLVGSYGAFKHTQFLGDNTVRFFFDDSDGAPAGPRGPAVGGNVDLKRASSDINSWWNNKMQIDTPSEQREHVQPRKVQVAPSAAEISAENAVRSWIENTVKLPQYTDLFLKNGFTNIEMVKALSADDLYILGINDVGHREMLINEAGKLGN